MARYLERLGLEAVILHEKPNEGKTVIEKIEAHSDVGFAVVLLTPDDVGAAKADVTKLEPRARQNVVLELGYVVGKLRRSRVCALHVPGVEIPSDFSGIIYVELDQKGAWRTLLAQELSNARMPINVRGPIEFLPSLLFIRSRGPLAKAKSAAREIPRLAEENARLRDDAFFLPTSG